MAGRPATLPFADICIPSVFDRPLAPAGQHVVSMFTQWVPHDLGRRAAPGRARGLRRPGDRPGGGGRARASPTSVLHRQVIGPHEMEHEYGLVGGNIFHGELSAGQMFHVRPGARLRRPAHAVRGLYQAGSATHGGGGVTGIPGRNVVRQIDAATSGRVVGRQDKAQGAGSVTLTGRPSTGASGHGLGVGDARVPRRGDIRGALSARDLEVGVDLTARRSRVAVPSMPRRRRTWRPEHERRRAVVDGDRTCRRAGRYRCRPSSHPTARSRPPTSATARVAI